MTIKMITLKEHVYGAKRLRAGDAFTVPGNSDARLLMALGRAQIAPAEVAAPAPRPAWMDETVETPAKRSYFTKKTTNADETPKPAAKRVYQRRDLTAED